MESSLRSQVYHYKDDAINMNFKVVVTLSASTVEIGRASCRERVCQYV